MDPAAVETLRAHLRTLFPPLTAPCPPAFFDNAAGSLVPRTVIEAVSQVLLERGVVNSLPGYPWGRANSLLKVAAHEATALFVNAPGGAKDVALGPSATALTFRVSAALARRLRPGDAVVCSELEHECNASPWRELSRVGVELRVWRAAWPGGALPLEGLRALLADGKVKLVALTAASNCFGLRTDVAGAAAVAHAAGAEIFVDAVHAAAHALPDVVRDDVDYLCFSPYKLCAPHLGALYVRSSLVAALDVSLPQPPAPPLGAPQQPPTQASALRKRVHTQSPTPTQSFPTPPPSPLPHTLRNRCPRSSSTTSPASARPSTGRRPTSRWRAGWRRCTTTKRRWAAGSAARPSPARAWWRPLMPWSRWRRP